MIQPEETRTYADFLRVLRRETDLLNEDPTREEIFSVERLEQYAAYLARELKVSSDPKRGRSLLPEVKESGRKLLGAYLSLADAIRSKQSVSPAAEWFVDNFNIIEDQLRGIKQDLPADYYYELPKLGSGDLKGYPRVYAMGLAFIAHTDSRLDAETLRRFIHAYQHVTPLQIGELWAIAITLRIALVEQLTPLAQRIVKSREKRQEADALADRLLALAILPETRSKDLIALLTRELGSSDQFDRAQIVQLTQRLRDQDPDVWPAFSWLEAQLAHHQTNTHQLTLLEHHRQAAAQVTVGNIISSMRLLSSLDWQEFVENVSLVDPILARDPVGAYSKMDFSTRDRYRHAIERIAKRSRVGELDLARKAISVASQVKSTTVLPTANSERRSHVGYYLIGDGLPAFEQSVQYKPRVSERLYRFVLRYPTFVFLGLLAALTCLIMIPVIHYSLIAEGHFWSVLCCALLAWIPGSELAVSLLNHTITLFLKPKPLPKMDTEKGVPEKARTMVVVPTLFTHEKVVKALIESMHVNYLANQDPAIYFGLLGDFGDATSEHLPGDSALLRAAEKGIAELNERYAPTSPADPSPEPRFYLFHRKRLWNNSEQKWIGWERKRGKIEEFNRILRGAKDTSYIVSTGPAEFLATIQYVITLDSDTQLPRDAAHQLIGTIVHPLNQPYYNAKEGRVTEGYGILQPRISVDLVSSTRSRFAQLFSGNTGIDPYTTAVSDVYQDLFLEGSFTGKGLYVVDAFEAALHDRVPENSLLSHDLFEGSFARSGLVTDVELFDDYPSNYETFSKRQHRWTRGDWQMVISARTHGDIPERPESFIDYFTLEDLR
jgi:cyclic beta-1,2-glucan synthetase